MRIIKSKINKILSTSALVTISKIYSKIKNKFSDSKQMKIDFSQSTYENFINSENKFISGLFDKSNFGEINSDETDKLLSHNFNKYSSETKKFQNIEINQSNRVYSDKILAMISEEYGRIDWQTDFSSGYSWDVADWYKKIKIAPKEGADIKYPWELGRMQDLPKLALSSSVSEFCNQVLDFIAMNPPRFGVQWKSAMDVGIRAVSWCISFDIFLQLNTEFDNKFQKIFINSLIIHKKHIEQNLEWSGGARGNHYFANICSLIILSKYLDKDAYKLIKILEREILCQFNPDGGNFEASLPYHFFALDMLVSTLRILEKSGDSNILSNNNIKSRLNKILEFSEYCKFKSGIPQIGDNDSGIFINLFREDQVDLNINFLRKLLDKKNIIKINEIKSFDDFGIYIYKSNSYELAFRCGSVGQRGKGGHSHNDQLSFVLSLGEREIFVDSGTYNYTGFPRERNYFRSTKQHNTLNIKDFEQNDWDENSVDDLFWIRKDKAKAKIENINKNIISGSHVGFGEICRRNIELFEEEILFEDECKTNKEKFIHLHIHPKFNDLINIFDNKINIDNLLKLEFLEDCRVEIEDYFYSESYGKKELAKRIRVQLLKNKLNWKINILNQKELENAN
jgi:Heparinase II/III-like protein/Heparinase II/III N-terminus